MAQGFSIFFLAFFKVPKEKVKSLEKSCHANLLQAQYEPQQADSKVKVKKELASNLKAIGKACRMLNES